MMIRRQYHCLISGLPTLFFDGNKPWTTPGAFRDMLADDLHHDDYRLVELVFLKEDNLNLVDYLTKKEDAEEEEEEQTVRPGIFTVDDFKEQEANFSAILPSEDILPSYMVNVMRDSLNDDINMEKPEIEKALTDGYFQYIMEKGSPFLKDYTVFEYNLDNLVSFIKAGKYDLDQKQFIRGMTDHAGHLASNPGKSPATDPEFELFDEIVSYSELRSFSEQEIKYDGLRWRVIDEMIFFEDFSIDRILGYLQQLLIADRWPELKRESGEKRLREIITTMVNEAEDSYTDNNK